MREYSINDARQNTRRIIHDMEIEDVADTKISKLSGGFLKRVSLGMTLAIDDTSIYFLDEPYAGLDVRSRVNLWGKLRNVCKEKKTVLISSHYLEDIQTISDHMLIMSDGKVLSEGKSNSLLDNFFSDIKEKIIIKDLLNESLVQQIETNSLFIKIGDISYIYPNDDTSLIEVRNTLRFNGISYESKNIGIEDVVIKMGVRRL